MIPRSAFAAAGFALAALVSSAHGAVALSNINNPTLLTFSTTVSAADFSYGVLGSGATTYTTTTALDTAVAGVTASIVNTALVETANATTADDTGKRSSTNGVVYTRPNGGGNGGAGAVLLMGTFTNSTGVDITSLELGYDLARTAGTESEAIGGLRVYYSLTGLANSWQVISGLSGDTTTTAAKSAGVTLSSAWQSGNSFYLLWVDDNNFQGDNSYSVDNLSITAVPEPSVALLGGLGVLALLRRRRA